MNSTSFLQRRPLVTTLLLCFVLAISACASSQNGESDLAFLVTNISPISFDEVTSDLLTATDPINPRDATPYRTYSIELESGQVLRLNADSSDFSTSIALYAPGGTLVGATGNHDSFNVGSAELVLQIPRSGSYLVVVSGQARGDAGPFHLEADLLDISSQLTFPGSVTGYLFAGGRTHPSTSAAMSVYPFELEEQNTVDIRLNSDQIDPFLTLVRADDSSVIAENDDAAGTLNSRIVADLPPGAYEIWASTYASGSFGRFTLQAEFTEFHRSDDFHLGQPYQGFLTNENIAIPAQSRSGQPLRFEVDEETVIHATMTSPTLDSYLVLTDEQGLVIAEDDDSAGNFNARITWPLQPGSYTLWATSFSGSATGPFQIETSLTEFAEPQSAELGSTIHGTLTQAANISLNRRTHTIFYTLEIEETTNVQIDLQSVEFDAYLILKDSNDQVIAEDDDGGQLGTVDARITHQLAPGTYRIGVTSYSPGFFGSFTLDIRQAAPSGQSV